MANSKLSGAKQEDLIKILQSRFEKHLQRHPNLKWSEVAERLRKKPEALSVLQRMEETGGEPDIVGWEKDSGVFIFFDCSAESPAERRSLCYDDKALDERKENKPAGSAIGMAKSMGIKILTETEYRQLQGLGSFDLKTSSWVDTPAAIRKKGGAIFCDRRYDHVFTYHNGAGSYYAARGFRGSFRL